MSRVIGETIVAKQIDKNVTEAELSVLRILWNHPDGLPVRKIVLEMYGRHEHSLHGGVKSFLDRLMEKGLVRVDKSGFAHTFSASVPRDQFVGSQLRQIAEYYFGGAMAPVLVNLVAQVKLSRKDREAIQQIIDNIKD